MSMTGYKNMPKGEYSFVILVEIFIFAFGFDLK